MAVRFERDSSNGREIRERFEHGRRLRRKAKDEAREIEGRSRGRGSSLWEWRGGRSGGWREREGESCQAGVETHQVHDSDGELGVGISAHKIDGEEKGRALAAARCRLDVDHEALTAVGTSDGVPESSVAGMPEGWVLQVTRRRLEVLRLLLLPTSWCVCSGHAASGAALKGGAALDRRAECDHRRLWSEPCCVLQAEALR